MNHVFTSTGTRQTLHLTFPDEILEGVILLVFATQFVCPKVSGFIPNEEIKKSSFMNVGRK
jgi:hypothetical protein